MADYNYNAPQYGAAPVAPAAPAKKPVSTKLIAIIAAGLVALIVLIAIIAGGVPGAAKEAIKDEIKEQYGYDVKGLDVELKVSKDGAKMLLISGRFKGEVEDDEEYEAYEDLKDGYFLATVITYKDEAVVLDMEDTWEKDDKDEFKDALKEMKEDFGSSEKEESKEYLELIVECIKEEDCDLEEAMFGMA